jgi:hypothetical protein
MKKVPQKSHFLNFSQIFADFFADSKTNIKGKTMLLTLLAGCDEIPAYAGMTTKIYFGKKRRGMQTVSHFRGNDVCRAAFLFKPKVPSFQRKLESAKLS